MPKLTPKVLARPVNQAAFTIARKAGLSDTVASVLARRTPDNVNPLALISPTLSSIDRPDGLPDIKRAARRICDAILSRETILCCSDFDSDGGSARAVIAQSLTEIFRHDPARLQHAVGYRLTEGYGLTDKVADRILALSPRPTLVITADQGSSDELRIARLAAEGIDVIVTDHHALPLDGPPKSAFACVSPARSDSAYPDASIAGCMVAFLLMAQVRNELIGIGFLPSDAPKVTQYLGAVATGTVADCVDMRSINNRAVVSAGLKLINAGAGFTWDYFLSKVADPGQPVTSESLAFVIGPSCNASSRMSDPMHTFRFLAATSLEEAHEGWTAMAEANTARKAVEREMCQKAIEAVWPQVAAGRLSIVHYSADYYPGVHGIVASRLVEAYGRPVMLFAPMIDSPGVITGSARTIDKVHIKDAFDYITAKHPGIAKSSGGHKGAGGAKLAIENLDLFAEAFEEAVAQQIGPADVGPRIECDGLIDPADLTLSTVDALAVLEPFGRQFPAPSFQADVTVFDLKVIGQDKTHLKLTLDADGKLVPAVWFKSVGADGIPPVERNKKYRVVFSIGANVYRGARSMQLQIQHADPLP